MALTRTTRFVQAHFRLILLALFISTAVAVSYSLFRMSTASARILQAHDRILSGREQVWKRFVPLRRYYGGLYTLVAAGANVPEFPAPHALPLSPSSPPPGRGELAALKKSRVFNPYPDYGSATYRREWAGQHRACSFGAGRAVPEVRVFDGVPEGMPDPAVGSYAVLGLDGGVCFDRYGRLGGYGYGYGSAEGGLGEAVFDGGEREKEVEGAHGVGGFPLKKVDWRGVDWGALQRDCEAANRDRFVAPVLSTLDEHLRPQPEERSQDSGRTKQPEAQSQDSGRTEKAKADSQDAQGRKKKHRTAVLVRTWTGYKYTADSIANLRSLVSELALLSGGEFHVHILVHVKDAGPEVLASPEARRAALKSSGLPAEFWGLAELWTESLMRTVYAAIPDPSARWRALGAEELPADQRFLQLPAHGVYRSTFMPVQWFSQRHPEYEYLWNWEMDVRFTGHWYHLLDRLDRWTTGQPRRGLWERSARFYVPSVHGSWDRFVESTAALANASSSAAAAAAAKEEEEPADLITFSPLFDPQHTTWILRDDVTGYAAGAATPRRAAIITASRLSRRLLAAMHTENAVHGRAMFSEMFPASMALHHGLKAVYAPHPVFVDRRWPVGFLEKTLNNGAGGFTGGRRESVFGDREHNLRGSTWYYDARFAAELYRGWAIGKKGAEGEIDRLERSGRMCLRATLLHPIKQ